MVRFVWENKHCVEYCRMYQWIIQSKISGKINNVTGDFKRKNKLQFKKWGFGDKLTKRKKSPEHTFSAYLPWTLGQDYSIIPNPGRRVKCINFILQPGNIRTFLRDT